MEWIIKEVDIVEETFSCQQVREEFSRIGEI